jgi:hypothetical protein
MNKFLPVLIAGLVAGVLSTSSFAEDAVKAKTTATATKTTNVKAEKKSLKKLAPAAKKMEEKKAEVK